jgi:Protein of unknown function (DUF5672)
VKFNECSVGFDRYVIGLQALPKELSGSWCGRRRGSYFMLVRFPARYFTDRFGDNRLLLTKEFYRAFEAYEYILIYIWTVSFLRTGSKSGAGRVGTTSEHHG